MGAPDGASDEARTRYLHLGKVALYQMSYTRNNSEYYNRESKNVKYKMKKFLGGRLVILNAKEQIPRRMTGTRSIAFIFLP